MKSVVTSFSMTLSQAQALAEATTRIKNRSAWINAAIESKIRGADSFTIADVSDQVLLHHYHNRFCTLCNDPTIDFGTCVNFRVLAQMQE